MSFAYEVFICSYGFCVWVFICMGFAYEFSFVWVLRIRFSSVWVLRMGFFFAQYASEAFF